MAVSAIRRDSRLPRRLQVSYRTQGNFLVSYSVNLSKGGVFIESSEPLPIGTEVQLKLDVPDAGHIDLVGHVAWVRQASPDGLPDGMGIQLREMDERFGEAVDNMVKEFMGLTVLVLASAQERLALLGRYVRSIMSCEILEATSHAEADAALASAPDLVILDVERGSDLGVETVEHIRARPTPERATPLILLAGDLRSRELGRAAGADEVLETPPSFLALQSAVIRTLSRPSRVATTGGEPR